MQNTITHFESLFKKTKAYTETSLKIYKLQAIGLTADIVSNLVSKALLILVLSMFLLFFNIGLSFYIGSLLDSYYLGFIILSGFYLLIVIVLLLLKQNIIISPVNEMIITSLQKENTSYSDFKTTTDAH